MLSSLIDIGLNSAISILRVLAGIALSIVIAYPLSYLRFIIPVRCRELFITKFIFEAPKFPPPIAWIPFVILYFGINFWAAIIIVIIGALPALTTGLYDSFLRANDKYIYTAATLELTHWQKLIYVYLPNSKNYFLTSLKTSVAMAWMSIVAAEMMGSQSGLGYAIQLARMNLQYDIIFVNIVIIGTIGWVFYYVINRVEKKWNY